MDILSNAARWMHDTIESCCKRFFNYDYISCLELSSDTTMHTTITGTEVPLSISVMSTTPPLDFHGLHGTSNTDAVIVVSSKDRYYPDWHSTISRCLNDGNVPEYMLNNAVHWIYDTLESCCKRYYNWVYDGCLELSSDYAFTASTEPPLSIGGSSGSNEAISTSIGQYYPDWDSITSRCLNDGNAPDYMRSNSAHWIYDTLESCCKHYFNWDYDGCLELSVDHMRASGDEIGLDEPLDVPLPHGDPIDDGDMLN